jgi:hypothetical protein
MTCSNQGRECPACLNASRAALGMQPIREQDDALVTPEEAESWVLPTVVTLAVFVFAAFCAVAFLGAPLAFPFN